MTTAHRTPEGSDHDPEHKLTVALLDRIARLNPTAIQTGKGTDYKIQIDPVDRDALVARFRVLEDMLKQPPEGMVALVIVHGEGKDTLLARTDFARAFLLEAPTVSTGPVLMQIIRKDLEIALKRNPR